jgi:hypothetical protein
MWNLSVTFCFLTTSIITASAIGERQMLPKQIIKILSFSVISKASYFTGNSQKFSIFSEFLFCFDLRNVQWRIFSADKHF